MYIIGDIHGRFYTLMELIDLIPSDEKIICVGDLVDRGLCNEEVIDFVKNNDNITSVLGNHDSFIVDEDKFTHCLNGGAWFYGLTEYKQKEIRNFLSTLPLSKTIIVEGKEATITHAPMTSAHRYSMLWERNIKGRLLPSFNIFGHNIVDEPYVTEDRAAIDTGMGRLTAIHWPSLKVISVQTDPKDVDYFRWQWLVDNGYVIGSKGDKDVLDRA